MFKISWLLPVAFVTHFLAFAQPEAIEVLENQLKSAKNSERVDILNNLSFKYLTSKPKLAHTYAEEALSLSKSLSYPTGEIVALNRLGEIQFRESNYAQAVDYTTQSLKLAEEQADSINMAMAYRVLGNIYTFGFKQYDLALQYQLNALKIYEKKKSVRDIASFCGNITWIYASTNQHLDEAHRLVNRGIHLSDSLGDSQLLGYNYNSKGLIFLQQKMPDSVIFYIDKSIDIGKEIDDRAVVAYDKSIKGYAYLQKSDFRRAIEMFDEAANESKSIHQLEVLKESYQGLRKSYEGLGNYQLAYTNTLLYDHLKDSLVNWETTQKALMTKMKFESEKREAKIEELTLSNQQERKEKIIYSILFAVVLMAMITVTVLVVQRSATNTLLEEKNKEIAEQNKKLTQANEIKNKFFSIIGHDLRSPLSSLKGLLGMVVRNEISDQEFKAFAPKLNQLVIGTNETLENLLQWSHSQMDGWNHSPANHELHPLVTKCTGLFVETAKIKSIELVNQVGRGEFIHADANQVELIMRNLIHNAIKFTPSGGMVTLTCHRAGKFVEMRVTDTGIGMSGEEIANLFKRQSVHTTRGTQGERGTGLGLMLCQEMIENNGGQISVTSEPGKGSTFHIFLRQSVS